jgi:diguanylate cyclase (GGDEF)-like protein
MNDSDWDELVEGALLALLEAADEGALVFDRDALCRMIGRRSGELLGIDPAAYVGKDRDEVLRAVSEAAGDPDAFLEAVGLWDLQEPPRVVAELDFVRPRPRRLVWTSFPVVREAHVAGRLVLVRDVTRERSAEHAQKELQVRVHELSASDVLTGLLNQRRFKEEIEREHGRSTRAWDSYAILRVDVDGMTELNAYLGMAMGDSVLEAIAACLRRSKREYDILARYDGDDFAALLPGADAVAAKTVADRFVEAVKTDPFLTAGSLSVSVGGSLWMPPSGERAQDILRRAGDAITKARAAGKGRVHIDAGIE